jgi:hypothetical protein
MTVDKMITKYRIEIIETPQGTMLKCWGLNPQKHKTDAEFVRANKAEIIETIRQIKEEERAAAETKRLAQENEKQAILEGAKQITVHYKDGEYLGGYTVYGQAAHLLEKIGAAKHVSGWGHMVRDDIVKALGETFTYPQVVDFLHPEQAKKEQAEAEKQAKVEQALTEAKTTGKPVEIARWTEPCDGTAYECSLDIVTRWAMPDGTIQVRRTHTH